MKNNAKKSCRVILLYMVFFAGLCIFAYPTISDWWNSFHQSQAAAAYIKQTKSISEQEKENALISAQNYNKQLSQQEPHFKLTADEMAEYENILNITGTGMIGYIKIPAINVKMPIYHGTSDEVLQNGAGHLEGSSFPIGGESTHAVLSSHCGLPSAKLFTDLDQLKEGDVFTIDVLGQTITYQVDQILVVLPDQMESLFIEEGKDYCTLCTCTPYGINTHRLLVRGARVENMPKEGTSYTGDNSHTVFYVILLIMSGTAIIFLLLRKNK